MIRANGKEMHEAGTGVGPVDALAKVLKKSLKSLFPEADHVKLIYLFGLDTFRIRKINYRRVGI